MRDKFKIVQKDVLSLPDGVYCLDECLYLRVRMNGKTRSYIFRMQIDGIRSEIALGSAKKISMAVARQKANKLRARLFDGEDIFTKEEKPEKHTFAEVPKETIENTGKTRHWAEHHYRVWRNSLANHVLPKIGKKLISDIDRNDILEVLEPVWYEKTDMASKLRGRIERIFDYASFKGWYDKPNPARWKNNLDMVLASPKALLRDNHHYALSSKHLAEVCQRCRESPYVVYHALLFTALTASRLGESVKAKWCEIDFDTQTWSVPPERRKDRKTTPHRVPLSAQSVALLKRIERTSSPFIFKSAYNAMHLNGDSVRRFLKKISGNPKATAHGMRSTFRDWCAENGKDRVLAEKSLMHDLGSDVERAYQRSDLLELRRPLMQEWADFLLGAD